MSTRSDILTPFGKNLRRLRRERGLTQQQLAKLSGSHVNYIGGLERGERNPTLTKLVALAEGLGCSLEALLEP
jgi:transcriptional regulator with XRE-family HTH domain